MGSALSKNLIAEVLGTIGSLRRLESLPTFTRCLPRGCNSGSSTLRASPINSLIHSFFTQRHLLRSRSVDKNFVHPPNIIHSGTASLASTIGCRLFTRSGLEGGSSGYQEDLIVWIATTVTTTYMEHWKGGDFPRRLVRKWAPTTDQSKMPLPSFFQRVRFFPHCGCLASISNCATFVAHAMPYSAYVYLYRASTARWGTVLLLTSTLRIRSPCRNLTHCHPLPPVLVLSTSSSPADVW